MNCRMLLGILATLPHDSLVMMEEELGCGDTDCGFSSTYPLFFVGSVDRRGNGVQFTEAVDDTEPLHVARLVGDLALLMDEDQEFDCVIGVAFDNNRAILVIRKD